MSKYKTDVHLYKILEDIRTRPGLYLTNPSVTELLAFVAEYDVACYTFDVKEEVMDTLLPLSFVFFTDYVARRFDSGSSFGWWKIILNQTAQDEEKGFQLFYTLLDEFKQLRISKYFAADLSDSNIAHHNTNEIAPKTVVGGLSEPTDKNPVKVFYAELTTNDAKHKSYIGVFEIDTESIIGGGLPWALYETEKKILAFFKMCFGTIVWQKQIQKNIPLK